MVPTTYVSFHVIERLQARVEGSFSRPLILNIEGPRGTCAAISLFLADGEQAERLANAINDIMDPPQPPAAACPHEAAAYAAARHTYSREDR